ncbi:hypothetical protein F5050DRAFT_1709400 [Lentinula boryana]|uniref:DUF6533 domain-containing protein n=1 Tax=Lentinula boryana TaxID=40481 RepID=A0ABQ8QN30_9AGAR|nr:hypothetical protein F5050DRAFT_1709400 [Lentinula boryana]
MGVESLATSLEDVTALAHDLQAFKWYYTACCTILFYDFMLTLQEEYEYIWNGARKGHVFYLFLLQFHGNIQTRYIPMAFCIITLFAYFSPLWTMEICNRFAIVEWVQTLSVTLPAETVLLIRVNALAGRRFLTLILWAIMVAQFVIVIYAMSQPEQNSGLPLPGIPIDQFHVCILYSKPEMDLAYLLCSIVFDSIVFLTTLVITVDYECSIWPEGGDSSTRLGQSRFRPANSALLSTIQRDGVLYFCAILSGNIIWLILTLRERPGLKFMNTQLTSVMINRLTLSLRKVSDRASIRRISMDWSNWSWPLTWNA